MILINWYNISVAEFAKLWQGTIAFFPKLVGALIVFLIGWFISVGIGKLVAEVLKKIQLNKVFEKGNWKQALEKADVKIDPSSFIGVIIKWVLMIAFLSAAVEILGFNQLSAFLTNNVLTFLPNVVVAAFIFVVAVIIADILEKIVRTAVEGIKAGYSGVAAGIVKWSIWIFAALAILHQLGIGQVFMEDLFRGIIAVIVITLGLAFGLGGKDVAAEILRDAKRKMQQ
jgi:hypothetical protein